MDRVSKEYVVLFNAMSDMIKKLGEIQIQLMFYQQLAEEIYITGEGEKCETFPSLPTLSLVTTVV